MSQSPPSDRDRLAALIRERAIRHGEFTLRSGQKATFYIDGKQITLDAEGAHLIASAILERIAGDPVDAIGGLTMGADPIVGAVLAEAGRRGRPLRGFLVRKEPKGHGLRQFLEGPVAEGSRVVIVDDVITTGSASLDAIAAVETIGAQVVRVIAIVDRLQGGAENFAARGYRFTPLFTIRELGIMGNF